MRLLSRVRKSNRPEQRIEANTMEHLRPNAIDHPECHLGPVLGRINMYAERPLAERCIYNLDDGCRDSVKVRVLGHDSGEGVLNLLAITFIWPCLVFGEASLVGRHAGMREVVGALGKRAWHDIEVSM